MIKKVTASPILALLFGFIGVFAMVGCSVTFPSDKFKCGKNDKCPTNLYCHLDDYVCRDTPYRGAAGEQISSPDGAEYAEQDGPEQSETGGSARAGSVSAGGVGGRAISGGGQGGTGAKNTKQTGAGGKGGARPGGAGAEETVTGVTCGDETCTDHDTGLEWQKCTHALSGASCSEGSRTAFVWEAAITHCDDLVWAGKDDWRLPSIQELITIVDYSTSGSAINPKYFPATPALGYWSASSFIAPSNPPYAWGINFLSGYIAYDDRTIYRTDGYLARCVRGEPLTQDLTNGITGNDLVVNDKTTSLIWQGCAAGLNGVSCAGTSEPKTWQEAKDYCEQLNFAGSTGWRLPTISELVSIVDYTIYLPAINSEKFPATPTTTPFWSSTPVFNTAELAWYVSFDYGRTKYEETSTFGIFTFGTDTSSADKSKPYLVRCVKGRPIDK